MTIYLLILSLLIFLLLYPLKFSKKFEFFVLSIIFLLLFVFVGFRYNVGGDYMVYTNMYMDRYSKEGFSQIFYQFFISREQNDILFTLLNVIAFKFNIIPGVQVYTSGDSHNNGMFIVNMLASLMFLLGFFKFALSFKNRFLALVLFYPIMVIYGIGYTRQSISLGALFYILSNFNFSILRVYFISILAFAFHSTGIVFILINIFKNKYIAIIKITLGILFIIYFILFKIPDLIALYNGEGGGKLRFYFEPSTLDSLLGPAYRHSPSFLASIIFLYFNKYFSLNLKENIFWISYSLVTILIYSLFYFNTIIIDRVLIYSVPLQIFVFVKIYDLINQKFQFLYVSCVSSFTFFYICGWFMFANSSFAWLPYNFYEFYNIKCYLCN